MLKHEEIADGLEHVSSWLFQTYLLLFPAIGCILLPNSSYFNVKFKPLVMKLEADYSGEIEVLSDGTNDKFVSQHLLLGKLLPALNKITHIKGHITSNTVNYDKIKSIDETEREIEKYLGKLPVPVLEDLPPAAPTGLGIYEDGANPSQSGVTLKQKRIPYRRKIPK